MRSFLVSHSRGVSILHGQVTVVLQIIGHLLGRSSWRSLLPSFQAKLSVKIIPVLRLVRLKVNLWRLWVTPWLWWTLLLLSEILFLHVISRTNMAHIRLYLVVGTLIAQELQVHQHLDVRLRRMGLWFVESRREVHSGLHHTSGRASVGLGGHTCGQVANLWLFLHFISLEFGLLSFTGVLELYLVWHRFLSRCICKFKQTKNGQR